MRSKPRTAGKVTEKKRLSKIDVHSAGRLTPERKAEIEAWVPITPTEETSPQRDDTKGASSSLSDTNSSHEEVDVKEMTVTVTDATKQQVVDLDLDDMRTREEKLRDAARSLQRRLGIKENAIV